MLNSRWPLWHDRLGFKDLENKIEGGLRVQGKEKISKRDFPLISYVTVVRNNEKDIRRTIDSVQAQTYKNVEHIILDGASTDKTLEIVKEYENNIDYFASEEDKGLYDALNKAIPLCRGDLICVLNSDDWLSKEAAKIVAKNYTKTKNELILASASVKIDTLNTMHWIPSMVEKNSYFTVANCCHNAIYATKGAYEASGTYDIKYKIAADFKWIMSCFDSDSNFIYLDDIVVNYSLGGISSDVKKHLLESQLVIKDKFPFLNPKEIELLNYIFYTWRENLNHQKYKDINVNKVLENLAKKYKTNEEFVEALKIDSLSLDNNKFHQEQKMVGLKKLVKEKLIKLPIVYDLVKILYHALVKR